MPHQGRAREGLGIMTVGVPDLGLQAQFILERPPEVPGSQAAR
jgi:hypothetical protein